MLDFAVQQHYPRGQSFVFLVYLDAIATYRTKGSLQLEEFEALLKKWCRPAEFGHWQPFWFGKNDVPDGGAQLELSVHRALFVLDLANAEIKQKKEALKTPSGACER